MKAESTKRAHEYYFGPRWPFCCLRCAEPIADPNAGFCEYHLEWIKDLCMRTVDPDVVPGAQLGVLKFIADHLRETGLAPSMEEIGEKLGFTRQAAHYHIVALVKRGLLTHRRGWARALSITPLGRGVISRSARAASPVRTEHKTDA